ncbi:hypothetical protein LOK80_03920 [Xylella fastidiosa subsp. multiplex]|uniref:hypothetical protein n=1 Tax=Xylella fastidiosa TaxID=2371 RepID=UPI00234CAFB5|nr:hypothetical protein [Xylella fastidiosa]MDC6410447.1 hypothetical protein [Xylella fastidiosa subsp. multiplex]
MGHAIQQGVTGVHVDAAIVAQDHIAFAPHPADVGVADAAVLGVFGGGHGRHGTHRNHPAPTGTKIWNQDMHAKRGPNCPRCRSPRRNL